MPTRIGQRLTATLVDRTVTRQEAEEVVAAAKAEKKWTPAMKTEVEKFVAKNAAKLAPEAKQVLEQFLAATPAKVDLSDPLVLKKHRTEAVWTPVGPDAKLFVDGINADDVTQGYIGDCYMMSGLSSVAAANPDLIKNAMHDNGDGTVTVRFFEGVGEGGRPKQVSVTIDTDLPLDSSGGREYGIARDRGELWVPLMEKAFAKWKGGYERIGAGGSASEVFEALSGKASSWDEIKDVKPDALFKRIQVATGKHKPVAAGTFAEDAKNVSYTNTGVHGDHFYTVLGATEENGAKYVQLRNPWGESEAGNDGKDDGIFKLPLADFVKLYENIEFGG